jgi:hypothetical protein
MYDFPSLTNAASALADLLVEQGRIDEASELAARARDWAPKDQAPQHARWRAAQARVLDRQGDPGAEALAREAVGFAKETDYLVLQGDCLLALADMLDGTGARLAVEQALERYERKGSSVLADKARALLAASSKR